MPSLVSKKLWLNAFVHYYKNAHVTCIVICLGETPHIITLWQYPYYSNFDIFEDISSYLSKLSKYALLRVGKYHYLTPFHIKTFIIIRIKNEKKQEKKNSIYFLGSQLLFNFFNFALFFGFRSRSFAATTHIFVCTSTYITKYIFLKFFMSALYKLFTSNEIYIRRIFLGVCQNLTVDRRYYTLQDTVLINKQG